jgi:hypothetical protein
MAQSKGASLLQHIREITLTGVRVEVKGQDPAGLHKGLKQWRKWLMEQDKDSP